MSDEGEGHGFAQLVLSYKHQLYCAALCICRNEDEANDLVQETFARALKHFARLRPDSNVRGWLVTIMNHLYLDILKKQSREVPLEVWHDVAADPAPPALPAHATLEPQHLIAAIAKLPAELRRVIEMKALEKRSYRDIGASLNMPVNTVGTRLRRARQMLFELLQMNVQGDDRD